MLAIRWCKEEAYLSSVVGLNAPPMKPALFGVLALLLFGGAHCRKEGPACHHSILFKNGSGAPVILAQRGILSGTNSCQLGGPQVLPGEVEAIDRRTCWEHGVDAEGGFSYYVLDTLGYQAGMFHPCDSLHSHYHILAQRTVSLADLRSSGFMLLYE